MVDNIQDNSKDLVINENQSEQIPDSPETESQNSIETKTDDEFIRITAAHQILAEAQKYEEENNYPTSLNFYRMCVDFLLEELMFTEGTEQSRIYLRDKCTAIMDRIDQLKTKLEPIPLSISTEQSTTNPPIDQLESLNLS